MLPVIAQAPIPGNHCSLFWGNHRPYIITSSSFSRFHLHKFQTIHVLLNSPLWNEMRTSDQLNSLAKMANGNTMSEGTLRAFLSRVERSCTTALTQKSCKILHCPICPDGRYVRSGDVNHRIQCKGLEVQTEKRGLALSSYILKAPLLKLWLQCDC